MKSLRAVFAGLQDRYDFLHEYVKTHPVLGEIYEIIDGSIGDYVRDHGLMYAAAVSFYALLSIIPLLMLFASIASYALSIMGNGDPKELERLISIGMGQLRGAIPYIDEGLERELRRMVDQRSSFGLIGIGSLLIAASQVFRALEFSFARIYSRVGAEREIDAQPRNFVLSKILFGAFMAVIIAVLIGARIVIGSLKRIGAALSEREIPSLDALESGSFGANALDAFVLVVAYTIVLRFFGGRRVNVKFAFLGGIVFCVGFWFLRWGYNIYLLEYGSLGRLYGTFSALSVVVLWIFCVATWMLIVGQLVKTVQRRVLLGPVYEKRWPNQVIQPRDEQDEIDAELPTEALNH